MNKEQFHKFMLAQQKEIDKFKWIESEKAGYDLGQTAVIQWIQLHAKEFYDNWRRENG